jgi:arylsulfatase A-like enzyme
MSLLTALYPSFHKLDKGGDLGGVRLDRSEKTLAQILKRRGYATAGLVTHPFLAAEWGFDRGFDLYHRDNSDARTQTDRASLWLEWHRFHASRGMAPGRFFLFVHYIDPHETYNAPWPYKFKYSSESEYEGTLQPRDKLVTLFANKEFPTPADFQYTLDLYDGEVNYVDDQLGRLFEKLEEMGLMSSTAIIFTSDHGEEFKDHGSMGHKETLYDEVARVPLIMTLPRRLAASQVIEDPVSLVDVLPTVLDLVGAPPLKKSQGVSLVPRMKLNVSRRVLKPQARALFLELGPLGYAWERTFYRRAIHGDGYKLIYNYLGDGNVTKELYRLGSDPKEQRNVYGAEQGREEVRRLEESLVEFIRKGKAYNPDFRGKNDFEINDEILEKLRALGYVE